MPEPTNSYHIDFDTDEMKGRIVSTKVTLEKHISQPNEHSLVYRVDLVNHPLYRKIFEYCMCNPPEGVSVKVENNGG